MRNHRGVSTRINDGDCERFQCDSVCDSNSTPLPCSSYVIRNVIREIGWGTANKYLSFVLSAERRMVKIRSKQQFLIIYRNRCRGIPTVREKKREESDGMRAALRT